MSPCGPMAPLWPHGPMRTSRFLSCVDCQCCPTCACHWQSQVYKVSGYTSRLLQTTLISRGTAKHVSVDWTICNYIQLYINRIQSMFIIVYICRESDCIVVYRCIYKGNVVALSFIIPLKKPSPAKRLELRTFDLLLPEELF